MLETVNQWLGSFGIEGTWAGVGARAIVAAAAILLAALAAAIAKRLLVRGLAALIARTETRWDDKLLARGVFDRLSQLAPALLLYLAVPIIGSGFERTTTFLQNAIVIYIVFVILRVVDSLLNAAHDIYNTFPVSREVPIRGFAQVAKLIIFLLGSIFILSIVVGRSPILILSGLGAMTAVLLLIFRDAILGFVAGIQLTANKMVSEGDWIEMPKYGADGDVIEVGLTTVKVQNWDKTVTTIPTYALISDAFKNWRGMQETGGRRIKRAICLDMNSIRFCTEEMLERYMKIQYIRDYLEQKTKEIDAWNQEQAVDLVSLVNGRRLTNIGTFRAYLVAYLRNHPMIHQQLTFLVRQLPPTAAGLPIEIYVFSKDTRWANYEAIQADIFDHILAVIPEFDLRVFQNPTGTDFRSLATSA